ncbi:hypothetical protein [Clostridium perfringens]|jgi:hypothetical protein|uniref:hypothetical protein n=1 Tax=Clostridium perfringens TaxID=1502 RepID=UPI001CCF1650|nr:hypothetical protein [Clostridium perfringens]UBK45634.1 hypothetical protein KLF41_00465 [Clostridium perfringens]UBK54345.1 hypothetical protein KLF42_14725 [Clostridium perfringens]UBL06794.1 hypothetical protein KLF33_15835 [Clostridium perfringens]DAW04364.1 MAG TPA: hypothetical protein [Caudoviricetes sp.]
MNTKNAERVLRIFEDIKKLNEEELNVVDEAISACFIVKSLKENNFKEKLEINCLKNFSS